MDEIADEPSVSVPAHEQNELEDHASSKQFVSSSHQLDKNPETIQINQPDQDVTAPEIEEIPQETTTPEVTSSPNYFCSNQYL